MEDKKLAEPTQKTVHPHKPTQKVQENAEHACKMSHTTATKTQQHQASTRSQRVVREENNTKRQLKDMTVEELIEEINAPMREYLKHADTVNAATPTTAWEQHKKFWDLAEAEE